MEIVKTMAELRKNMETLDVYLNNKVDPAYSFALNLVKKGVCFVAVKHRGSYRFYPSRFIGYAKNNMNAHENNSQKDGKETNPAISKLLSSKPAADAELEKAYEAYCEELGFTPNQKGAFGVERKYWRIAS